MLLKASRITNLTDARYFAARAVQYLGFNLEEGTEGFLDPLYMRAIREWVEGPKIMGEFSRSPAAVVREAASFFGLDAVQVTQSAGLPDLAGLEVFFEVTLPAVPAETELLARLRQLAPQVGHFVLNFTENEVDWRLNADFWRSLCTEFPILLHLDVPTSGLREALETLQAAGLVLRGGEEEKVGVKSFDELEEWFDLM